MDTIKNVIVQLINEYRNALAVDRREFARNPFVRPVLIEPLEASDVRISALCRDISAEGIGLAHALQLGTGEVIVTFDREYGSPLRLRCQIEWSEPCGDIWFFSGGRIIEVLDAS